VKDDGFRERLNPSYVLARHECHLFQHRANVLTLLGFDYFAGGFVRFVETFDTTSKDRSHFRFGGFGPSSRSSRYVLRIVSRAASVNSAGGKGGDGTHLSNGVSASSLSQLRFFRRVRYRSSSAARSAAAFA
jgi:hypothetical protein